SDRPKTGQEVPMKCVGRLATGFVVASLVGCGGSSTGDTTGGGGGGQGGNGGIGGSSGSSGATVTAPPDSAFIQADIGSYAHGDAISGDGVTNTGVTATGSGQGCGALVGVVRDFKGYNETNGHPDFEHYKGDNATTGLVQNALGPDAKPVYASQCETSAV